MDGDEITFDIKGKQKAQGNQRLKSLLYRALEAGWLRIAAATDFLKRCKFDWIGLGMRAVERMERLRQWLSAELLALLEIDRRPLRAAVKSDEITIELDVVVAGEFVLRSGFDEGQNKSCSLG